MTAALSLLITALVVIVTAIVTGHIGNPRTGKDKKPR